MDGKKYQMSELKGRTVLLVFFATWCSPCMKELP
ncbi:MAG: TlpA family protein disulfide reductase [Bacteroidales bacterium]|nr:TlpA family protein disulfide reductase [Bacteroidales bacterium]